MPLDLWDEFMPGHGEQILIEDDARLW